MKNIAAILIVTGMAISLLLLQGNALASGHPELKAFPAPNGGLDRFVIVLPHESGVSALLSCCRNRHELNSPRVSRKGDDPVLYRK